MRTRIAHPWREITFALGVGLLGLVVTYATTSASIFTMWARDPLGHGYLILPAAMYLAWTRRGHLSQVTPKPAFWWLPILGAVSFVWLVATLTSTTTVQQFCLLAMFVGFVWGTLGTPAARALALPLGFLVFALPIGDYLVPMLQQLTAGLAVSGLRLTGVPVLLRGEVISIAGSSWEVAAACSGINYLMSALVMAYLYAGLFYRSQLYRVSFFLAAAPVALLANGVRVYITILVASMGAPEVADGLRHSLVGWLVFGVILFAMLAISGRFQEPHPLEERNASDSQPKIRAERPVTVWATGAFVVLGLALVAVAPVSAGRLLQPAETAARFTPPAVSVSGPWKPTARDVYLWSPQAPSSSAVFARTYDGGSQPVKLSVAYYSPTEPDVELGSKTNADRSWLTVGSGKRTVMTGEQWIEVNETALQSQTSSLLVWSWFRIDQSATSSDYLVKLLVAKWRLTRSERACSQITVATRSVPGTDAVAVLRQFLTHLTID